MLVQNQLVEVKVGVKTLKHYKQLGYDIKCFDTIMVPPEHLTLGSNYNVQVQCDICGKIIPRSYEHYVEMHIDGYDTCNECKSARSRKTCMEKYGVEYPTQLQSVKDKTKNTNIKKYGVEYAMKLKETQEKAQQTNKQRYGVKYPIQNTEIRQKTEETMLEKYGVKYASQSDEIRKKIQSTVKEKYGVDCISQSEEIKEKKRRTLMEHYGVENSFQINGVLTSSQQIKLYDMIQKKYPDAILNHPFSTCYLDVFICVNNICIDIEYDGNYWHKDQQRDIKRDKYLQSQGFKTLRIRSGHLLPTEEELFDAIDYLVDTDHIFKEIILSDWKGDDEDELLLNSTAV